MGKLAPSLQPVSLLVDQEKINLYAEVTRDNNPIHVDPAFAAKTEMGSVIAHGTLSLNLIWQSLGRTLGEDLLDSFEMDVRFRRPVRVGDRVEAGGDLADDGRVYNVWVRNQAGDNVIEGSAAFTGQ